MALRASVLLASAWLVMDTSALEADHAAFEAGVSELKEKPHPFSSPRRAPRTRRPPRQPEPVRAVSLSLAAAGRKRKRKRSASPKTIASIDKAPVAAEKLSQQQRCQIRVNKCLSTESKRSFPMVTGPVTTLEKTYDCLARFPNDPCTDGPNKSGEFNGWILDHLNELDRKALLPSRGVDHEEAVLGRLVQCTGSVYDSIKAEEIVAEKIEGMQPLERSNLRFCLTPCVILGRCSEWRLTQAVAGLLNKAVMSESEYKEDQCLSLLSATTSKKATFPKLFVDDKHMSPQRALEITNTQKCSFISSSQPAVWISEVLSGTSQERYDSNLLFIEFPTSGHLNRLDRKVSSEKVGVVVHNPLDQKVSLYKEDFFYNQVVFRLAKCTGTLYPQDDQVVSSSLEVRVGRELQQVRPEQKPVLRKCIAPCMLLGRCGAIGGEDVQSIISDLTNMASVDDCLKALSEHKFPEIFQDDGDNGTAFQLAGTKFLLHGTNGTSSDEEEIERLLEKFDRHFDVDSYKFNEVVLRLAKCIDTQDPDEARTIATLIPRKVGEAILEMREEEKQALRKCMAPCVILQTCDGAQVKAIVKDLRNRAAADIWG